MEKFHFYNGLNGSPYQAPWHSFSSSGTGFDG